MVGVSVMVPVGVRVMVGVAVMVAVCVALDAGCGVTVVVAVAVDVAGAADVRVAVAVCVIVAVIVGVGVKGDAQPLAVQASQQLAKPVEQLLPPPAGALHFAALDFTEHLVRPLLVVRQQVTHPGARPQVERLMHFFTSEAHDDSC